MESGFNRIIDIFHHHKRFSAIQKLVILALVIGGVSLLTGYWICMVTFILTLISTVFVCHYLITTNANFTIFEDLLILLKAHENDPWYTSLTKLLKNYIGTNDETPTECEPQHEEDITSWEEEIHILASLISQDFIKPWYLTVSKRQDLLKEKEEVIYGAFRRLCLRFSETDINELISELLCCYREHLRCFQLAKSMYNTQPRRKSVTTLDSLSTVSSIEEAFEFKFTYHSAVWESENEISYLKSIISILLTKHLDTHLQESKTPHVLLVEILTYNVAKPVFDLLSNADFLHECIIRLLSDEAVIKIPQGTENNGDIDLVKLNDVQEDDSDEDEFLDPQPEAPFSPVTGTLLNSSHNPQPQGQQESEPTPQLSGDRSAQVATTDGQEAPTIEDSSLELSSQSNREQRTDSQSVLLGSFDDLPEGSLTNSRIFLKICITDTETATENRGANQYTLYTIQYDAVYEEEGTSRVRTNKVKRRFREFINLQSRLEGIPEIKKCLKDVKGLSLTKWLSLPFGNMDRNSIEKRKITLENFMKALLEKDNVCNSSELKEFLAYDGNAHIAFVRKAPDSVQHITKMIRSVSTVFDKIGELSTNMSELLPSLPRKTQTKDIQSSVEDEDQIQLEYGTIKGDLQRHWVLILEKQFSNYVNVSSHSIEPHDREVSGKNSSDQDGPPLELHDTALTEIVVDIVVQALQGRNSWICRERVISLAKHMLGTAVNRWLQWKISDLTTPHRCAFYLHLFRESIWPDGKYDSSSREVPSEKQRSTTKAQAQRVLAEFFPDVLVSLIDPEDYQCGIAEIIDSIQYKKLNKHFIYTFLDIIMEKLFSETPQGALQKEGQGK